MNDTQDITLIVGSGPCAKEAAAQLAAVGERLLIVTTDPTFFADPDEPSDHFAPIELLTDTQIRSCRQNAETFRLELTQGNTQLSRSVTRIVVAAPERRKANFTLYHLHPSLLVVPLSYVKEHVDAVIDDRSSFASPVTIAFLTSLYAESNPVIAAEVMLAALDLQSGKGRSGKAIQTYILVKNLKVAADGLEALYRETKAAGTIYIKFTDQLPDIVQSDETTQITFTDDVTGLPFRLTPDITVVDETILPPQQIDDLSAVFGLEQDDAGFAQADNVHRLPIFTNRKGILVAGSSRHILGPNNSIEDAYNAAMGVTAVDGATPENNEDTAIIDKHACIRCLTCHRICPHEAIFLEIYPQVAPAACEGCGICAAECPQHVITIPALRGLELADRIASINIDQSEGAFVPRIITFCCRQSGSQAARLAELMGNALPQGLGIIEVPCAGSVSAEHLVEACLKGADGVLVLTCHEDNCHSSRGNRLAHNRIEQLIESLAPMGYDTTRIKIDTLASNMGAEFARVTRRFAQKIATRGPSPLSR